MIRIMGHGPDSPSHMVQLAPGVRIDSITLDESIHVAEVAAKEGGKALLPPTVSEFGVTSNTRTKPIRQATGTRQQEAEKVMTEIFVESGLGFEVYGQNDDGPKTGWSVKDDATATNSTMSAPIPRAPTWFVHISYQPANTTSAAGSRTASTAKASSGSFFSKRAKTEAPETINDTALPIVALVSVGMAINMVPAIGVIYDAIADKIYAARKDQRAMINGRVPMEVNNSIPEGRMFLSPSSPLSLSLSLSSPPTFLLLSL